MRTARTSALLAVLTAMLSACGGGTTGATATPGAAAPTGAPAIADRPASPAVIELVSPVDGSTVKGDTVIVTVAIQNAHIVQATSTNIRPDEGHVHLYIDGNLQYMAYALSQPFTLKPGTYTMYAEFVASDHFPFNPRVYSKHIVFTVT